LYGKPVPKTRLPSAPLASKNRSAEFAIPLTHAVISTAPGGIQTKGCLERGESEKFDRT
jgi:hypothetical protein